MFYSPPDDGAHPTLNAIEIDPIHGVGQVQINLFTSMEEVCWMELCVKGDGRGFDDEAVLKDSRATILVDFDQGIVWAGYHHSRRLDAGGFPLVEQFLR